jgi:tripartite-type tricarboxylate transporter receptor subunit TctC
MPKEDGTEFPFINWIFLGFPVQDPQPPHPAPERRAGGSCRAKTVMRLSSSTGLMTAGRFKAFSLRGLAASGSRSTFRRPEPLPVAMMALDEFILWTNAEKPYKSVKDYVDAVKAAPDNTFKMGGTGSKQEDQIITVALEKATGKKMTYIPYKGGGEVAVQLVGNHVDSTVNNPIEAVAHWRAGKLRALCVFDNKRLDYKDKITADHSWNDIPTCKEEGLDLQYLMLRAMFLPGKVTAEQTAFYVDLFKKVTQTAEYKDYMEKQALKPIFLTGADMLKFLESDEALNKSLMTEAGFVAN